MSIKLSGDWARLFEPQPISKGPRTISSSNFVSLTPCIACTSLSPETKRNINNQTKFLKKILLSFFLLLQKTEAGNSLERKTEEQWEARPLRFQRASVTSSGLAFVAASSKPTISLENPDVRTAHSLRWMRIMSASSIAPLLISMG